MKVARVFIGNPAGLWPKPDLDFGSEIRFYRAKFADLKNDLSGVDFTVDGLLESPDQVASIRRDLENADGILVIHLSLQTMPILREILAVGQPTMVFSAPYSGHEWSQFGTLRSETLGKKMDCVLTSDYSQLASCIRPFRAIHHLREARILNVTARSANVEYEAAVKQKFGTEIVQISSERVLATYQSVSQSDAEAEARRWIKGASRVVEPSEDEIARSCRLALAFEKILNEEAATLITVDCYGSMYHQLPAYPCIGFTRLNDMGLGGICESDLRSAMTHILFQGLAGKPGFISDPTVDESDNSIILAHCLGTTRMDGPGGPAAPYQLRSIMERREGAVAQVKMQIGQRVTQAILVGTNQLLYFMGEIIDTPEVDRGCRTKIRVQLDGDAEKLWKTGQVVCTGRPVTEISHRTLAGSADLRILNWLTKLFSLRPLRF